MKRLTFLLAALVNPGCGTDTGGVTGTDATTSTGSTGGPTEVPTTGDATESATSSETGATSSETGATSSDASSDTGEPASAALRGGAEKGPLLQGSSISAARLRKDGEPTGDVWQGQLLSDAGEFDLGQVPPGAYAIVADGYAFDEVRGALGSAPISLRAVCATPVNGDVFVNVVTHLANRRVLAMLAADVKVDVATVDAQAELVAALPIGVPGLQVAAAGTAMSVLAGDDPANRYLLAASALLGQAAVMSATNMGDTVDAHLQQWLDQISADLADDGALTPARREQLEAALLAIDPSAVEANLGARMAELGLPVAVPELDLVLDQDRDGLVNADDNCDRVANPNQEDADADAIGDACDATEPELLADKLEQPWAFTRHGEWIYFTTTGKPAVEDGGVWRVPFTGGAPELLSKLPYAPNQPAWLAASADGVFWSDGLAWRMPLAGGEATVAAQLPSRPLALDATHLYFANTHTVQRVPLAGGPLEQIAADFSGAYELTLDATRVYWSTAHTVESVGKDGSDRQTLAVDQSYAAGVASDGVHLFWVDVNECAVRRVPVAGGPTETLWARPQGVLGVCAGGTADIALHGDHVYWGSLGLQRVAKTGGALETLLEGDAVDMMRDVEVDDTHVYWLNLAPYCNIDKTCDNGSLWRIARPQ